MADIFSGLCEKQGFVCRYGGHEYIIVFFTADKEGLKETAKQIYQKIDQADGFEKAISEKLKKQIPSGKSSAFPAPLESCWQKTFMARKKSTR